MMEFVFKKVNSLICEDGLHYVALGCSFCYVLLVSY